MRLLILRKLLKTKNVPEDSGLYGPSGFIFNKLGAFLGSVSAAWAQAADHESGLVPPIT
jgi:hypothetical protein